MNTETLQGSGYLIVPDMLEATFKIYAMQSQLKTAVLAIVNSSTACFLEEIGTVSEVIFNSKYVYCLVKKDLTVLCCCRCPRASTASTRRSATSCPTARPGEFPSK